MNRNTIIQTHSIEQKRAVGALLKSIGEPIHENSFGEESNPTRLNVKFFNNNGGEWGGADYVKPNTSISFQEFLQLIAAMPPEVKIELNSEYTATITKDTVKVGCQIFPISIIDKLVEARNSLTN